MNSARLSIVAVFMSCSFLLSSLVSANAQDLAGEDPAGDVVSVDLDPVTVDDLTEDQFTELAALSVAVRSAAGVSATSGNITNDVAAILQFLQQLRRWPSNNTSSAQVLYVMPMAGLSNNLDLFSGLRKFLSESDSTIDRNSGYLYEIQRILYGQTGYPSSGSSIYDFVKSISERSFDLSFTNDVAEIVSQLQQSNTSLSDIYSLDSKYFYDFRTDISSILGSQTAFTNWIDDFEYGNGSQWGVHVDDMQLGDLLSAIHDSASVQTNANSGPQETVEDIRDILESMQESLFDVAFYAEKIHSIDLEYEDTDRSVRRDFGYWNASNQTRSVAVDLATIIESLQATASGSYTQLTNEVETAYAGAQDLSTNPTNAPLPSYEDLISGNDSGAGNELQSGASSFSSQVDSLAGMLDGSSNDEIVVIPEMTIGGIHVSQRTVHLTTSVTPVARRIMVFIWGCCLFASLFSLASSEWAFYANLGRNWVKSGGFIYGPSDEG